MRWSGVCRGLGPSVTLTAPQSDEPSPRKKRKPLRPLQQWTSTEAQPATENEQGWAIRAPCGDLTFIEFFAGSANLSRAAVAAGIPTMRPDEFEMQGTDFTSETSVQAAKDKLQ